eukprot:SAG31_NODE_708_length_12684_cov_8.500199_6_plen_192_part_00
MCFAFVVAQFGCDLATVLRRASLALSGLLGVAALTAVGLLALAATLLRTLLRCRQPRPQSSARHTHPPACTEGQAVSGQRRHFKEQLVVRVGPDYAAAPRPTTRQTEERAAASVKHSRQNYRPAQPAARPVQRRRPVMIWDVRSEADATVRCLAGPLPRQQHSALVEVACVVRFVAEARAGVLLALVLALV